MLFSFRHLAHVAALSPTITVEEVVAAINQLGFEVERYAPATAVRGVKFGQVLSVKPNPHADQLSVCEVQFEDKIRTIQTAATNVRPHHTVIAFVPGASNGEIVYGPKTLKSVVSEGMLAALSELGVPRDLLRPENTLGVFTLNTPRPLTENPLAWLGLDDYIIDVTILSNRADANSYLAMALELSGFFGTRVILPVAREAAFASALKVTTGKAESLTFLEAVKALPVSLQEQILLAKSKFKSVNDIVDLTNLTLLMTGQPVHAYDATQVKGPISAEYVSGPVRILGDKAITLQNDLVITSNHQPIALAGVIGLQAYAITNVTTRFFLEFGRFKISDVRHAIRAVRFSTQAAGQSSREFTSALTHWAVAYVSARVSQHSAPINLPPLKPPSILLAPDTINGLVGEPTFTSGPLYAKAVAALTCVGFEFKPTSVRVAAHISHVSTIQDLVEEIMRFVGYENLTPLPLITSAPVPVTLDTLPARLVAAGYLEVITYDLIPKDLASFNPHGLRKMHVLQTPVSSDHETLRPSAAPALVSLLDYHDRRKLMPLSIGEISYLSGEMRALTIATQIKSLSTVKADLTNLLQLELEFQPWQHPMLHPGVTGQIVASGRVIGWLGKFYPGRYGTNPLVAEVQLGAVREALNLVMPSHAQLQTRDLTFKLAVAAPIGPFVQRLKQVPGVVAVWQIDAYAPPGAAERSVTLRVSGDAEAISAVDKLHN